MALLRFRTRLLTACALAAPLVAIGPSGLGPTPAQAAIVERVVAVVGEKAILLSDLRDRARPFLVRVYENVPDGPQRSAAISQVYKAVLGRIVEEELEDRAASKAGIVVTAKEVDQALARVAAQNGVSEEVLFAEAKRSGLTESQYRDELRRQVLQAKLVNVRLQGRIRITESDLKSAYRRIVSEERAQLRQRLMRLAIPAGSTASERQKQAALANSLVERAQAGDDFRDLVERYSVEPEAQRLQPSRPPIEEPPALRRATAGLDVGGISQPVRVGDFLVIVQVIEREQGQIPTFEEARPALHERVYIEKMGAARQHWLDGLRKRTHVDIRL